MCYIIFRIGAMYCTLIWDKIGVGKAGRGGRLEGCSGTLPLKKNGCFFASFFGGF
jgi:hypothetical protein